MHRHTIALILATALLGPGLARAQANDTNKKSTDSAAAPVSDSDKDFLIKAYQGNLAEVKLGQLAKKSGQSADVKSFADKMVQDHSKAVDQIKTLAAKKNVSLPIDISADEQKTYDDLAKLSGAEFDKAYMDEMVKDHDQDVREVQSAANTVKDKDIRNLASEMLPTMKNHQNMAHSGGASKHM
jgi:putative membrane protein